jgi:V8-like Glu-specific endopeptidase
MSRGVGYQAGMAALGVLRVLGVLAAIVAVVVAVTIGVAETGETAQPTGPSALGPSVLDASVLDASVTGPAAAVTDQVSEAAQRQALAHWTRQRMRGATATALPRTLIRTALPAVTRTPALPRASRASPEITAPKGIPTASPFSGSPTTGVLFYTTGGKGHFCTASVVDSTADDLALTAAHCVYSKGFAANIEYVPGYRDGKRPYGVWPVRAITVTNGWKVSHDPDLDFAFLTLAAAGGKQIQAKTGGLTIRFTRWYSEKIEVIGHNDSGVEPIRCATKSFRFRTGQMEFYCHGFWTGTSGGPWIIGYNAKNGTGTVFGVIGGYELGGDYEWASYSAYFGSATRILYEQVERAAAPHPTPTPTATGSPTPSKTPTAGPTASVSPTPTTTTTLMPTGLDTTYPTSAPSGVPGAAGSAVTSPPTATPSPAGSVSIAYRAPVLSG